MFKILVYVELSSESGTSSISDQKLSAEGNFEGVDGRSVTSRDIVDAALQSSDGSSCASKIERMLDIYAGKFNRIFYY